MFDFDKTLQRMQAIMLQKGLTQSDVARAVGIDRSAVSSWFSGRSQSYKRYFPQIASALGTSVDYLIGTVDETPSSPPESLVSNLVPLPETKKVPLLGDIACGEPILAIENIMDFVTVPSSIYADMALICKGESMTGARIFDGDLVYIRAQEDVDNGEIAAVLIGDEATLKRVYKFPGVGFVLSAENPAYEDMIYKEADAEQVHIIGKAVAFTSTVR